MKLSKSLLALVASAMVAGMVYAEDKPAAAEGTDAKPAAEGTDAKPAKKEAKAKTVRLIQPYSLIEASLTQEQKEQLAKIQAEYNAEVKKLREKADAESMAVLNDAQKTELQAAVEKKAADAKAAKAAKAEKKD